MQETTRTQEDYFIINETEVKQGDVVMAVVLEEPGKAPFRAALPPPLFHS